VGPAKSLVRTHSAAFVPPKEKKVRLSGRH
jgi:hypothetical protein